MSKKWPLPLLILMLLLIVKCKDSSTQITGSTSLTQAQANGSTNSSSSVGNLAAPSPITPSPQAKNVARAAKFKWKAVDGAKGYELDASHGNKMVFHQYVDSTSFTSYKALAAKTTYYWRVRAIKKGKKGKWSGIRHFTTRAKLDSSALGKLPAPLQGAPSDSAKNVARLPKFTWKAVDGADRYILDASHGNKMVFHQHVKGTSFTPRKALAGGTRYYWRVRAIKNGMKGKWSGIWHFTTKAKTNSSTGNLSAPKQVAPSDKENNVSVKPNFKWKAVDAAGAYILDVSHGNKMVLHQRIDSTGFTPKKAWSAKTTYYWRVRAIRNGTKGKWSATHSFTTAATGSNSGSGNTNTSGSGNTNSGGSGSNSGGSSSNTGNSSNAKSSVSADRQALMDLYKATNGSGWSHHSGWGTGEPMGSWYGIKTNSRGRV
ncbi:MAG TPA: hypothetical protein VE868_04390, partial [Balneolaceae bacterium]|nr:hypothetical protein [Balneolaceae bacterium]